MRSRLRRGACKLVRALYFTRHHLTRRPCLPLLPLLLLPVALEIQATIPVGGKHGLSSVPPMMKGVLWTFVLTGIAYFGVAITGFYAFGVGVGDNVLLAFAAGRYHAVVVAADMFVVVHVAAAYQVRLRASPCLQLLACGWGAPGALLRWPAAALSGRRSRQREPWRLASNARACRTSCRAPLCCRAAWSDAACPLLPHPAAPLANPAHHQQHTGLHAGGRPVGRPSCPHCPPARLHAWGCCRVTPTPHRCTACASASLQHTHRTRARAARVLPD